MTSSYTVYVNETCVAHDNATGNNATKHATNKLLNTLSAIRQTVQACKTTAEIRIVHDGCERTFECTPTNFRETTLIAEQKALLAQADEPVK